MSRAGVQAVGGGASLVLAAVAGVIGNQLSGTALWAWITFPVVLVIGVCVTVWVARLTAPLTSPDEPGAAALARALAGRVRAWSTREQEAWRIGDPRPLSVRWHTAARDLFDEWHTIHGAIEHGHGDAGGGGPVSLAGGFTDIGPWTGVGSSLMGLLIGWRRRSSGNGVRPRWRGVAAAGADRGALGGAT